MLESLLFVCRVACSHGGHLYSVGATAMRHAKQTLAIVSLSLALTGCRSPLLPLAPTPATASIRLVAEESAAPLLRDLANGYHPANTLVSWEIRTGSWRAVENWLDEGAAPFGITSYLPDARVSGPGSLWSTPIGQDALTIVTNRQTAIATLTSGQLRGIFTGRVLNWREIGGPDIPITVVVPAPGSANAENFRRLLLGERKMTSAAILATSDERMITVVGQVPGAAGFLSMRYRAVETLRPVAIDGLFATPETVNANQYSLRAPLLFVGTKKPVEDDPHYAFFAWVQSPAGQEIVGHYYGTLPPGR